MLLRFVFGVLWFVSVCFDCASSLQDCFDCIDWMEDDRGGTCSGTSGDGRPCEVGVSLHCVDMYVCYSFIFKVAPSTLERVVLVA